ncbi:succinate dehydrogenase cytochrome b558 subunit [Macrococcoides bohemicum]|uniref:Succinate dehydrogenase n=2 Tax=Staphylococcaceae TaxID=90964 RepID=A0A328A6M9_9STAP|nr:MULTISPECIES: succinate dehydrogenase cytochrome b558 subunit [Macrococcus]ATD30075.1 succinate dehydrogenase [Macrococcus sp. IME1552]MBC9873789.1 succinate dehydrogenase cytochrome b558 subunit [Macrococcus bohemicus]MCG7419657.1 succinate dehydrogenase cytochrome b558 subunit [Macrococcus epidermidis]MCH4984072.1 succinate dehydrogenase cytochrome b558 subunit [Macrococcus sp. PK]QRN50226.1 succinate dehydrogenase [Macrococcus bohemicus]
MASSEKSFALRRLHSLLGVIPLGVFLIQHLVINHFAVNSPEAFNNASDFMWNLPFKIVLETLVIYLPILFHAIYGVYIAFTSKNNVTHYSTFRNWMFLLQRITGIIAFIFIAIHVWQTRVQAALGHHINYDMMADLFNSPINVIGYVIGIVSVIFHFSNGLWSFAVSWGITQSDRSQKIMAYVSLGAFLVITFIGLRALFAFM